MIGNLLGGFVCVILGIELERIKRLKRMGILGENIKCYTHQEVCDMSGIGINSKKYQRKKLDILYHYLTF